MLAVDGRRNGRNSSTTDGVSNIVARQVKIPWRRSTRLVEGSEVDNDEDTPDVDELVVRVVRSLDDADDEADELLAPELYEDASCSICVSR